MSVKLELISSSAAYREIDNRVQTQPVNERFFKSVTNVVRWEEDELLSEPYKIVCNIDKKINNKRIKKISGAQTRRKIFMKMIRSRMVRFNRYAPDILKNEGIEIHDLVLDFAYQYHSTEFIIETIQQSLVIQNQITLFAKNGKRIIASPSSEIVEAKKKLDQVTTTSGKNLFRQYVNTREEQILEDELSKTKADDLLTSNKYTVEDICYSIVNGNSSTPEVIELDNVSESRLRARVWRLSPTAHKRLIETLVKIYKAEDKNSISEYRNAKCKARKLNWSKRNNKKLLSAQEKRDRIKQGKAEGIMQKEIATQIGCSVRLVQKYWNG